MRVSCGRMRRHDGRQWHGWQSICSQRDADVATFIVFDGIVERFPCSAHGCMRSAYGCMCGAVDRMRGALGGREVKEGLRNAQRLRERSRRAFRALPLFAFSLFFLYGAWRLGSREIWKILWL